MATRFDRQVIAQLGDWAVHQQHFYALPAGHIITGFVLEPGTHARFIWRFCMPICDKLDFFYLTFGNRLPGPAGYIPRGEKPTLTPGEFVENVRPYIADVVRLSDLNVFAATFSSRLDKFAPVVRRSYAAVLILLRRFEEAAAELRRSVAEAHDEADAGDTATLLSTLLDSPDKAIALLDEWEAETRRRFNIP